MPERPNIVVMGVPRSGTTVLMGMLYALGWRENKPSDGNEIRRIRRVASLGASVFGVVRQPINPEYMSWAIGRLKEPWAIKGIRFVTTLDQWVDALMPHNPVLIWIDRDVQKVTDSWARKYKIKSQRRVRDIVKRLGRQARWQYEHWPGVKVHIHFEDLTRAVASFDLERAGWRGSTLQS